MSDPTEPNYTPGVGRLATDRFDFQKHVDGYSFRHNATQIDLFPAVVISSVSRTNTQQAIAALASAISPPSIPDATSSVKGILRLNGDLGGTATTPQVVGLRGYPISSVPPNNEDILMWNGSTWTPSVNTSAFTAGGDLGGTNTVQQVNALTGLPVSSGNLVTVNAGTIISFQQNTSPLFTQNNSSLGAGIEFTIRAQSSNLTSASGGNLVLAGGKPGNGGLHGGIKLQLTNTLASTYPNSLSGITSSNMLQITEVAANRRVLSLVHAGNLSTADMPVNTGDMVIYVRNAVTNPTASPTNGFIFYGNSGNPYFYTSGGLRFGLTGTSGSATSGSSGALPGTPAGYLNVNIGGTTYKIPYYNN